MYTAHTGKICISFIIITLAVFFDSCKSTEKETDIQAITELAMEMGDEISARGQQVLSSRLLAAIDSGGVGHALQFCNLHAYPILDSVQRETGASIKRVSDRWRNPNDAPDSLEQSILNDFSGLLAEGGVPDARVVMADDAHMLYARPIMLGAPLCLSCHGVPGEDIAAEHALLIGALYPNDRAIGHKIGDLRGMWSIRLEKTRLQQMLDERETTRQ